jgi:hypothetical protein
MSDDSFGIELVDSLHLCSIREINKSDGFYKIEKTLDVFSQAPSPPPPLSKWIECRCVYVKMLTIVFLIMSCLKKVDQLYTWRWLVVAVDVSVVDRVGPLVVAEPVVVVADRFPHTDVFGSAASHAQTESDVAVITVIQISFKFCLILTVFFFICYECQVKNLV